jgi:hypothetical protein
MSTKAAPAPKALGVAGRALWCSIAKQWAGDELEPDARERRLLEDACHEADVLAALSAELDAVMSDGVLTVKGSQGQPVTHPHVSEARRSRAQIAALLGKLSFTDGGSFAQPSTGLGMSVTEAGRLGGLARRHSGGL